MLLCRTLLLLYHARRCLRYTLFIYEQLFRCICCAVSMSHAALVLSRSCTLVYSSSGGHRGSQKGFVEKLVQRIVDNIEINVADIHIRCFFLLFLLAKFAI